MPSLFLIYQEVLEVIFPDGSTFPFSIREYSAFLRIIEEKLIANKDPEALDKFYRFIALGGFGLGPNQDDNLKAILPLSHSKL